MAADIPPVTPPEGGWRDHATGGTPVTAAELNERDAALLAIIAALNSGDVPDALAARIAVGGDAPTSFTFTQTDPATVWTVVHPLPFRPAGVTVVYSGDDATSRLVPVEHIDAHTLVIRHGAPSRGVAYLS